MIPILVAGILAAGFVVYQMAGRKRRRHAALAAIRSSWGARKTVERDMERIASYHRLTGLQDGVFTLDDRTWSDLDMDAVFAVVDRTSSTVGQQVLYRRLRTPRQPLGDLERFDRIVRAFTDERPFRENVQIALAPLNDSSASYLPDLFLRELPAQIAIRFAFPLLTVGAVLSLLLAFKFPVTIFAFMAIAATNLTIRGIYWRRIYEFVEPLRIVNTLIAAGRSLSVLKSDVVKEELTSLARITEEFKSLNHATAWLVLERNRLDELSRMVIEYLNMMLLLDINAFVFSLEFIRRNRDRIRALFEGIGGLDAAISVASWRHSLEEWCAPGFNGPGRLEFVRAVHPLVPDPVPNSLELHGRGLLVTGSNMSGKTTFIRAIAINAVLVETIYTASAARFQSPPLEIRTLIGGGDNILEGKSYYLAEVEGALDLLRAAQSGRAQLLVFDELFRGTNTVERISAAKAVLEAMQTADNFVVASTHDLELCELLAGRFDSYHFRELIVDDNLTFDFQLQPGPSSTRNAIALLELAGFPGEVVEEAMAVVKSFDTHSQSG